MTIPQAGTGAFENWAGNIAEIGAIYPFAGSEVFWFILALVFWLGWHAIQLGMEAREWQEDTERYMKDKEMVRKLIES